MNQKHPPQLTLFSRARLAPQRANVGLPYSQALRLLERAEDSRFDENELAIFSQVLEHETPLYEPRGWVSGPIELRIRGSARSDLRKPQEPVALPAWVEADGLAIERCDARGILLIEHAPVLMRLHSARAWQSLNMVLITGGGLPRSAVRRFVRRVAEEFRLPTYLLTDNDTWGYFCFSLLKRGVVSPRHVCPFLAIKDLRFLGLRAGSDSMFAQSAGAIRPWKSLWDRRLAALSAYPCFKRVAWKREFATFKARHAAVGLTQLVESAGVDALVANLTSAVSQKQWLR